MREERRAFGDFAVMYRTNAQSRAIEEACIQQGIRYRIVGGTRFYDRREIRDLLAYLRLIHNHADAMAFRRIVNVPGRGIGDRSLEQIGRTAEELERPLLAVAAMVARGDEAPSLPRLRGDIRIALRDFVALIDRLSAAREHESVARLLDAILEQTRYREHLQRSDEERAEVRWENVQELRSVAAQYEDLERGVSLASFLEEVALVADVDDPDSELPDAVTLTTLHAAKGLEFPVVFMPGVEEGLLPHFRSLDDPAQMEEERRVCYVGMTPRAAAALPHTPRGAASSRAPSAGRCLRASSPTSRRRRRSPPAAAPRRRPRRVRRGRVPASAAPPSRNARAGATATRTPTRSHATLPGTASCTRASGRASSSPARCCAAIRR